jgi:predicted nucleic acid-binding protein
MFPGYVIDTNALIDLWRRHYAKDVFPQLWELLEKMIADQELIAPQEVLAELRPQNDELYRWATKQDFFKDLDAEQVGFAKEIVAKFPNLVDPDKTIPDADPFVVALARSKGWKVVSAEKRSGVGSRPKIPNVCEHYTGMVCLPLLDFFRDRNWRF